MSLTLNSPYLAWRPSTPWLTPPIFPTSSPKIIASGISLNILSKLSLNITLASTSSESDAYVGKTSLTFLAEYSVSLYSLLLYLYELSDFILFINATSSDLSTSLFVAILARTFLATDKKSLLKSPKDADCLRSVVHLSSSLISHLLEIVFSIVKSWLSSSFNGFWYSCQASFFACFTNSLTSFEILSNSSSDAILLSTIHFLNWTRQS